MSRTFAVAALSFGMFFLAATAARAEVLADGSYAPTGNAAIDSALVVVNAMNREIKDQQDLQQVFINRAKLEKTLDRRLEQLQQHAKEIRQLRVDALSEADKLRKGAAERKRAAQGDATKEAEAESMAQEREAELTRAADRLTAAEKSLSDARGFGDQMRRTLHSIGGKGDKQALADWEGGVRHNYMLQQQKMEQRLKAFGAAVADAGQLIQKGSPIEAQHEEVGAFVAELVSFDAKKTELYVNGAKLAPGERVDVGKDRKIELRAELVDPRRRQSREIETRHVEVSKHTDYQLAYSFNGKKSDWKVTSETYEWKTPATRTGAQLMVGRSSSGAGGKSIPKDDVMEITFSSDTAVETIRADVYGTIEWQNGPVVENDSESASVEIRIGPRH